MECRDGKFYSVFDEDFEWALRKAKIEAASGNHTGGYYLFASVAEAKAAFARNVVFNQAWQAGKELVLVECDYAGRVYRHHNPKHCATFCRPTKVLVVLGTAELDEA